MKTLLWLDDYRNPYSTKNDWLVFSPIGRDCEVYWVKNYDEFVKWIVNNGLPDAICFDHDLGEEHIQFYYENEERENPLNPAEVEFTEKTGYDCAKWLIDYCIIAGEPLPLWNSQSANPVGRDNINGILNNYKKYYESKCNK